LRLPSRERAPLARFQGDHRLGLGHVPLGVDRRLEQPAQDIGRQRVQLDLNEPALTRNERGGPRVRRLAEHRRQVVGGHLGLGERDAIDPIE
jgi:hypothetical protein